MNNTYKINTSTIKINNTQNARKKHFLYAINKSVVAISRSLICAITILGVFYIFNFFDTNLLIGKEFNYSESIALGALFSTFGSSIVTITSIFCEHCIRNINLNIETLQSEQLCRAKKWTRWPFVERISKHSISIKAKEFYIYSNPSVKFCNLKKDIYIPLSTKDFYELKIFHYYIILKLKRKDYRKILAFQADDKYLKDILIWDCLLDTYKNIIVYKTHKIFSYIGWSIVVSSLILSFLYPNLITYFYSIVFAIPTVGA